MRRFVALVISLMVSTGAVAQSTPDLIPGIMSAFPNSAAGRQTPWTPTVDQWISYSLFKQDVSGAFPLGQITGTTGVRALLGNGSGGVTQGVVSVPNGGTGVTSLTVNAPLLGNGTGNIAQGTRSGSTTELATVSGTPVNGNCASWNTGNVVDAGSPCGSGGGGSGTVTSGTAGQVAAYATSGTTVSGENQISLFNTPPGVGPAAANPSMTFTYAPTSVAVSGTAGANCGAGTTIAFPCVQRFLITGDTVNSATASDLDGWQFDHFVGGSTVQGARETVDIIQDFTAATSASNANRNYVPLTTYMQIDSGDGGTSLAPLGAWFGANFVVRGSPTNGISVEGQENDINITANVQNRIGFSAVSFPSAKGSALDAAYAVGSALGGFNWSDGILFATTLNGGPPVQPGGCLVCEDGTPQSVGDGFYFPFYTFTNDFLASSTFVVAGNGKVTSDFGYDIRSGTTGANGANTFNIWYTGSNAHLYIDSTDFGAFSFISDPRVKHDIVSLPDGALDRVMALRPVEFNWADVGLFRDDHKRHDGFLTTEVESVIPDAVNGEAGATNNDGSIAPQSMNMLALVSVLTKGVQELKAEIDAERQCRKHWMCRLFGVGT